jgi:hypothetical protein
LTVENGGGGTFRTKVTGAVERQRPSWVYPEFNSQWSKLKRKSRQGNHLGAQIQADISTCGMEMEAALSAARIWEQI